MRVIALVGEPASGKSSIARQVLYRVGHGVPFKTKKIFGTVHNEKKLIVFGEYRDGEKFGGTDRFSMAAQPEAEHYLGVLAFQNPDWTVFFEGDRLGNVSFLRICKSIGELRLFVLDAPDSELERRHKVRGDTQKEAFLKGRRTKIKNIVQAFPEYEILPNYDPTDFSNAASRIILAINNR